MNDGVILLFEEDVLLGVALPKTFSETIGGIKTYRDYRLLV